MLRTLAAILFLSSAFAQDACSCGLAGAACCRCEYKPKNELCLFDTQAVWCAPGLMCDGQTCYKPDLQVQSLAACGDIGEECCPSGWCSTGLTCSNLACINPDGVVDSSPCGFDGAQCCGLAQDCDEDLICEDGTCA